MAEEAEFEGAKRPRGCAESRDHRGCTLLMLATEKDDAEMVKFLASRWKAIDEGNIFLEPGEVKRGLLEKGTVAW